MTVGVRLLEGLPPYRPLATAFPSEWGRLGREGITGFLDGAGTALTSVGLQCAVCHSIVDDSVAPGIGRRLDGWANPDLDPNRIIALAPDLSFISSLLGVDQDTVRTVLHSWGPGKFDAELLLDGKAFRPDGGSAAVLIPPAFGLAGVNQHTWTGAWGTVTYWNALVANLELRGKGVFFDPRFDNAAQFPIAAAHPDLYGHKRDEVDLITAKLPALHVYQLSLPPRRRRPAASMRRPLSAATSCSAARRSARTATLSPSGPSQGGTCIPRPTSGSTTSRRTEGLITSTARRRSRALDAPEGRLLSRRALRHAEGRHRSLQLGLQSWPD